MRLFFYSIIFIGHIFSQNIRSTAGGSFGLGYWQEKINPTIYYKDNPSYINFSSIQLFEIPDLNKSSIDINISKLNTGIKYRYFHFNSYLEHDLELRSYLAFNEIFIGLKYGYEYKTIESLFKKGYSKYSLALRYDIFDTTFISEAFYDESEKSYNGLLRVVEEFELISTQYILSITKSDVDSYFLIDTDIKGFVVGFSILLNTTEYASSISYTVSNINIGFGINFNDYLGMSKSLNIAFLL